MLLKLTWNAQKLALGFIAFLKNCNFWWTTVSIKVIWHFLCSIKLPWGKTHQGKPRACYQWVGPWLCNAQNCLWGFIALLNNYCPACRTSLIATRFWVVVICPIIKCLTVLEFSFILFDLCLFITIFNFILNYVPIVTFWIFTYHKIWILLIIFCFIWNYWIIYFSTCLEVFWSVVS